MVIAVQVRARIGSRDQGVGVAPCTFDKESEGQRLAAVTVLTEGVES